MEAEAFMVVEAFMDMRVFTDTEVFMGMRVFMDTEVFTEASGSARGGGGVQDGALIIRRTTHTIRIMGNHPRSYSNNLNTNSRHLHSGTIITGIFARMQGPIIPM